MRATANPVPEETQRERAQGACITELQDRVRGADLRCEEYHHAIQVLNDKLDDARSTVPLELMTLRNLVEDTAKRLDESGRRVLAKTIRDAARAARPKSMRERWRR